MRDYIYWESTTRHYAARLTQDLFGSWVLQKAWGGRHNNLGNTKTVPVGTYEAGVKALAQLDRVRQRRHYKGKDIESSQAKTPHQ